MGLAEFLSHQAFQNLFQQEIIGKLKGSDTCQVLGVGL